MHSLANKQEGEGVTLERPAWARGVVDPPVTSAVQSRSASPMHGQGASTHTGQGWSGTVDGSYAAQHLLQQLDKQQLQQQRLQQKQPQQPQQQQQPQLLPIPPASPSSHPAAEEQAPEPRRLIASRAAPPVPHQPRLDPTSHASRSAVGLRAAGGLATTVGITLAHDFTPA